MVGKELEYVWTFLDTKSSFFNIVEDYGLSGIVVQDVSFCEKVHFSLQTNFNFMVECSMDGTSEQEVSDCFRAVTGFAVPSTMTANFLEVLV